jgi:hypothetical protein
MLIVIENFYQDPWNIREYALEQTFDVQGNYPGYRTKCLEEPQFSDMKKRFEKILNIKITCWPTEYNTAFQFTTAKDETWIHHDETVWAGVLYLTPDPPIESGTSIYRNKNTKVFYHDPNNEKINYDKIKIVESDWEQVASIGNIFNRLVLYHGKYFHRSLLPGFGDTKDNGRLFQTFFFDT